MGERYITNQTNTFHFVYVRVKELTKRYDFNIVLNFEMESIPYSCTIMVVTFGLPLEGHNSRFVYPFCSRP